MLKRLFFSSFMGAVLFGLSSVGFAGVDGSVFGTVVDTQGIALPHIKVQLLTEAGEVRSEVFSSETGEYSFFPVMMGTYQVWVQDPRFRPFSTSLKVSSSSHLNLGIQLGSKEALPELQLKVQAQRRWVQNNSAKSSLELTREQIVKLPQGSETTLPRLIATTTPGIVQGPFGQTFVRGNHANIQYQVDGVQLPDSPSNTFGQAISPRNIDHMEVITGGVPAEYGQRLSAVVNIVTKTGPENPGGEVELNWGSYGTTSPHLIYGGSNESGSLHYYFSVNYNRTDRGIDTPQPESYANQHQGGAESIHNTAYGNSEFAKVDWLPDNQNKLLFIVSHTQSRFEIPNFPSSFKHTDPFFQPTQPDAFGNLRTIGYQPSDTDDSQKEMNAYTQIVWKHTLSEKAYFQLAPYFKYSAIQVQNDPEKDLFSDGKIPGVALSSFAQDRRTNNLGVKGDYSYRVNENHLIKAGFQLQGSRSDGRVSIQTRLANAPQVDETPNVGYFEGVYIHDDFALTPAWVLNLGLRWDAAQFSFADMHSNDSLLQPRLGLNYMATETTQLHLFYGKLFQPAPVETLRYQSDIASGSFVSLNAYDIKAEKDDYYEVGVAQQLPGNQVATLNFYYKDGVNVLDDTQISNTAIAQPYNFAQGFAYGAEFSLKGPVHSNWSHYLNYSYGIAKGKGLSGGMSSDPADDYQFMDHLQIHTANLGIVYSKDNMWWTTQGAYGSGLRTGTNNSMSLPGHFTLDTTVGYQFGGSSWFSQFKVSADVLNIFDNRYPITIANGYSASHYAVGRQFFLRLTREL